MKIGIIGLGLIGGSLGLDLRDHGHTILGVSRRESTCQRAIERGVVDEASIDLGSLSNADIIFICTPIGLIIPTLEQLISHLKAKTIVTDVGSVKTSIVEQGSRLWDKFIGGHPMAGTAEQGIDAAQKKLFKNAPYVITPTQNNLSKDVEILENIANELGSKVYTCTSENHDCAVAWISHLPVMISASLISACLAEKEDFILKLAQNLASSGFRDTSRVGGGNPELGVMMAEYNQKALLRSLLEYRQELDQIIGFIEHKNWHRLSSVLKTTQQERTNFL
ncbi:MAG: prephenate/arogenate dehydrogenase [cyanobacterium endosymbiont of Rhopalodia musculus]|uniref:prephenate/arogenate dehydrogenase n=1 Tax=cyanobacterium endosymbiont of Epithemia clementina EcSB TaxID=3034674 RepID=UPI0024816FC7|nr:prephenate/arogenate dehydrogenase [cyanobacterium endosymbiont of Epithemia clementina EcSB]WGT67874.1 prephenate/arogenate dehydrogenase [cyanobacterium endosymbiont of Epithemia clementina EcSB]